MTTTICAKVSCDATGCRAPRKIITTVAVIIVSAATTNQVHSRPFQSGALHPIARKRRPVAAQPTNAPTRRANFKTTCPTAAELAWACASPAFTPQATPKKIARPTTNPTIGRPVAHHSPPPKRAPASWPASRPNRGGLKSLGPGHVSGSYHKARVICWQIPVGGGFVGARAR